jgi:hypothetical protein
LCVKKKNKKNYGWQKPATRKTIKTKKMNSFNNDQTIKDEILKKLLHHQELDAFVQGAWLTDEKVEGDYFKGCFYGCTMQTENNPREAFSEKYNIDLWYCYLTEKIFEGLPKEESKSFPYASIDIVPLGFDFNKIKSEWFKQNLIKQKEFVKDENVLKVLDKCILLFETPFNEISKSTAESAWESAKSVESARLAAESAWSAAESARLAAESAWSAASSARLAANSAWSAAWSARSSAKSAELAGAKNHYIWMRDLLFKLISEA